MLHTLNNVLYLLPTIDINTIKRLSKLQNPDTNSIWLIIFYEELMIGIIQVQELSKISCSIHLNILPDFQNKKFGTKLLFPLLNFIKYETSYKTITGTVSENNKAMNSLLRKTNFKVCGLIPKAIIWNNELTNLYIYYLNIGE